MVCSFNRPQAIRCLATLPTPVSWGLDCTGFNRPQAIRCLATRCNCSNHCFVRHVSIARRRFVVLRPLWTTLEESLLKGFNRPQAIRCLATSRNPASPCSGGLGFNRPQAIRCLATRQRHPRAVGGTEFQSPAGDSLSCDYFNTLVVDGRARKFQSPAGDSLSCDWVWPVRLRCDGCRFNRPQAIRCLATWGQGEGEPGHGLGFQSPAGDSLSCDATTVAQAVAAAMSFNRPQAIRCLATLRPGWCGRMQTICFNRPQAIRCLATFQTFRISIPDTGFQSPAGDSLSCDTSVGSCRRSSRRSFQSPAGDSLSCDRSDSRRSSARSDVSIARRRFVVLRLGPSPKPREFLREFQSPAGDSLSCDFPT